MAENLDREMRQGEFVTGLIVYFYDSARKELVARPVPFAVIAGQDCDLLQDFDNREGGGAGVIASILIVEAEPAIEARGKIGGSDLYKRVVQNKDERYQFVQACAPDRDLVGDGLPDLVLDFRSLTSIPAVELYNQLKAASLLRRTRLDTPYREHLQLRLANYLSRVAVPVPHRPQK